jgi:hypothetical protein
MAKKAKKDPSTSALSELMPGAPAAKPKKGGGAEAIHQAKKADAEASAVAKKGKAKKPGEPAAEPADGTQSKKDVLPRPQLRVLKALADAGAPMTKAEITAKAKVNAGIVGDAIGRFDAESRAKRDEQLKRPSLLTRGYIKAVEAGAGEGGKAETRLELTDAGKEALGAALAELGGKLPKKAAAPFSKNPQPEADAKE